MKKSFLVLAAIATVLFCGCKQTKQSEADTSAIQFIFETDMGNDVDDAVALDIIHKYADKGILNLLAVGINKDDPYAPEYIDIMNTWYGRPDIPMGIVKSGVVHDPHTAKNFVSAVSKLVKEDGTPLFERSLPGYENLPEMHILYRQILSQAEDASVVIASVGFSTNLVRLLATEPDEISPLTGVELVAKKVKLLSVMGGRFFDHNREFNIEQDIPAAATLFTTWPTAIIASPWELGDAVKYPGKSIEEDFTWAGSHPMVEGYKAYLPMPYDRPMWDPTSVIYAVEGDKWFNVSEAGIITVDEEGYTTFKADPAGKHYVLSVNEEQAQALVNHLIEMATTKPANK